MRSRAMEQAWLPVTVTAVPRHGMIGCYAPS